MVFDGERVRVERHDEPSPVPSPFGVGLRLGIPSGALVGCYAAMMTWLRTSSGVGALRSWAITATLSGVAIAILFPAVLFAAARLRQVPGRVSSTRQRTVLDIERPAFQVFPIALAALSQVPQASLRADLATGVLRKKTTIREPLIGKVDLEIETRVEERSSGSCRATISTESKYSRFDLGGARRLASELADRLEEQCRDGRIPHDAEAMDSLPKGALRLLGAHGQTDWRDSISPPVASIGGRAVCERR